MRKLAFEEKADQLVAEVSRLLSKIRTPCKASKDLENSADSTFRNIGEGISFFPPRMKAAKYGIARGEAGEVKRALIALVRKRKLTQEDIKTAYGLADEICALLTTTIKNLQSRPDYDNP